MERLEEILKTQIKPQILRYSYLPYQIHTAMEIFKKIGQKRGKDYIIDSNNKFVIENLIKWAHNDETMVCLDPMTRGVIKADTTKGIYIAGRSGTGKSLIFEILAEYLTIDNVMVRLGESNKLLTYRITTTNKICGNYQKDGDLFHYIEEPIYCFQDLGAEQRETLYMGTRTSVMKTILQERGDNPKCITLISSNNKMLDEDNRAMYEERVLSRLKKMCNYFELKGEDRRK